MPVTRFAHLSYACLCVCVWFTFLCAAGVVYMGEEDTQRQSLNVFRMHVLGAKVQNRPRILATV